MIKADGVAKIVFHFLKFPKKRFKICPRKKVVLPPSYFEILFDGPVCVKIQKKAII